MGGVLTGCWLLFSRLLLIDANDSAANPVPQTLGGMKVGLPHLS